MLISDYEQLRKPLEDLRDSLGLIDKGEEKGDFTLVGDLGHARFLSNLRPNKKPEDRALLVIRYLNSICDLYIDNLIKEPSGYWICEPSTHAENPLGNNFESLAHLLSNIAQYRFRLEPPSRTEWMDSELGPQRIGHL